MTYLGLFFVGAVLFVDGLMLLGRVDGRAAAPINIFVGGLLIAVALNIVLPLDDLSVPANLDSALLASGFVMFAFTYLYVGICSYTGHSMDGLGWFCLWACAAAVFMAITYYTHFEESKFGMIWVLWAVFFAFLFLVLGLGLAERFAQTTAVIALVEAFVTASIPGALLMLNKWGDVGSTAGTVVGLASLVVFALFALRGLAVGRQSQGPAPSAA